MIPLRFTELTMIENERQYHITKSQADKFYLALCQLLTSPTTTLHPLIRKAQEDAIRSQLEELQAELTEYESRASIQ